VNLERPDPKNCGGADGRHPAADQRPGAGGEIDRFTIDMLVNMLVRAGIKVDVNLKDTA